MKPTIIIVLDTRREKKNETYPIKIRIGYQRMQRYYPTGIDTTKEGFEKIMSATPKKIYLEQRIILDNQMRSVRDAVDQLNNFSFSRLDHFLGQSPKTVNDIFPVFHDVINEKKSLDKVRTAELYQLTIKALKKYHPKIGFYDVTPSFLKNLESQMTKDGYSKTTIGIHFRNLRAIYNRAIALKIVRDSSEYPFKKHSYIIPQSRNVKKALTKEEVLKIAHHENFLSLNEQWARDMWLFSYLANGLNPNDIFRIKKNQLQDDTIIHYRRKTENTSRNLLPIVVYLRPEAKKIIERWGAIKSSYLFAGLNDDMDESRKIKVIHEKIKQVNRYMKKIASRLGIDKPCSFQYARHSYATIMKNSGQSMEFISEALGHHSVNTTRSYLASFRADIIKKAAENLL